MRNTPRGKTTMLHILDENHSYRMKRTMNSEQIIREQTLYKSMKVNIDLYFKE